MKGQSKRKALDAAKNHYDICARTLKAHESLWQDMWMAQPNPFLRIQEYISEEQVAMRKPIIDAWLDAKAKYDDLVKKTKFREAMPD